MSAQRSTHRKHRHTSLGIGLALGLLAAGSAAAEMITLAARRDNTLIEHLQGALSNGAGPHLFAGRTSAATGSIRRGLLAFDVGSVIPPGSTILSAALTLHLSQTNSGPVHISLHRALADWGEGASTAAGGGGAPAAAGDATWLHTFYAWGSEAPSAGPAADVQNWLDEPSSNHGWVILEDESSPTTVKRFDKAGVLPCAERMLADLTARDGGACSATAARPPAVRLSETVFEGVSFFRAPYGAGRRDLTPRGIVGFVA